MYVCVYTHTLSLCISLSHTRSFSLSHTRTHAHTRIRSTAEWGRERERLMRKLKRMQQGANDQSQNERCLYTVYM